MHAYVELNTSTNTIVFDRIHFSNAIVVAFIFISVLTHLSMLNDTGLGT